MSRMPCRIGFTCGSFDLLHAVRTYSTEEELYNMLSVLVPDVRILGADWKGKEYTGHNLGHNVFFNSRNHSWSSAELRRRVYEAELKKRT